MLGVSATEAEFLLLDVLIPPPPVYCALGRHEVQLWILWLLADVLNFVYKSECVVCPSADSWSVSLKTVDLLAELLGTECGQIRTEIVN